MLYLARASLDMALHRSKLGPVGGDGGGGKGDGGVVVDLDPLSAFALMGQSTEGANALRGTEPDSKVKVQVAGKRSNSSTNNGNSSNSGETRVARNVDHQTRRAILPPPLSVQPTAGMGEWQSMEVNFPAVSSQVRMFAFSTAFLIQVVSMRSNMVQVSDVLRRILHVQCSHELHVLTRTYDAIILYVQVAPYVFHELRILRSMLIPVDRG